MKAQAAVFAYCLCIAQHALSQQPKPEPLWQAFAAVYDANKPIVIQGTIIRSDWREPRSVIWLKVGAGDDAKLWRVDTSPMSLFDEADRSRVAPSVMIAVCGYGAKDGCADMCREAGRGFMLADGSRIAPRNGQGVCSTEELIKEACAAASRPGPPPQIK